MPYPPISRKAHADHDVCDSLAAVLYKPLLEKEIKMTSRVSGQSRGTPEGV